MLMDNEGVDIVHVYPTHDQKDHDLSGRHCWCLPEYDIRFDRICVYHNDADSRAVWQMPVSVIPRAPAGSLP